MTQEELVDILFKRAVLVLKIPRKMRDRPNLAWKPMRGRKAPINTAKSYSMAYVDIVKGVITLDIYTPRKRQPKSLKSILRLIAHEVAHIQKPPFRQLWKGRIITRQHYPRFYKQVNRNVKKLFKDKEINNIINQTI